MAHIEQIPSYLTWKIRHRVMYPDLDFDKAILPNDDEGMHLGLFDHNTLISVVSLFKTENRLQFRKFATLDEYQGQGYGSELLNFVIQHAINEQCSTIWCNARKSAGNFYRKFGFSETGETSRSNNIDYVIMEKTLRTGHNL